MRIIVWVVVAWLATAFFTTLAAELPVAHIIPSAAVIVAVFVAMQREPIEVTAIAVLIGYGVGRQALAPVGLHEFALGTVALGVHLIAGHLAAGGRPFFFLISGVATVAYHVLVYALLVVVRGEAGFVNWATAMLVPAGLLTALVAALSHGILVGIERRLVPEQRESLAWR